MKKLLTTGKKSLSVFLAIIMMLTIAAPAAFASDVVCDVHEYVAADPIAPACESQGYTLKVCRNCGVTVKTDIKDALGHDYDDGTYKNATCTEPGGTVVACKRDDCGFSYFVEDKNAPATGHKMSDWHIVQNPDNPEVYAKIRNCLNTGCLESEYEKDSDGNINVYFKVEFINNKATGDGEDATIVTEDGTVLRVDEKSKEELLDTIYVLKGTEAKYTGKKVIIRNTLNNGFIHNGWVVRDAKTGDIADNFTLSNVQANIKAYTDFKLFTPVHEVTFSAENGQQITKAQQVIHGGNIQFPFDVPTKESDSLNNYEFDGWYKKLPGVGNSVLISQEEIENLPIYEDATFIAHFKTIKKQFKVVYEFPGLTNNADYNVTYGGLLDNVPDASLITKANDETYIYEFSGKWMFANGAFANPNNFTFVVGGLEEYETNKENDETLSDAQKGIIRLYPYFFRKTQEYAFNLHVMDVDGSTEASNGNVQILDASRQFVSGKKLDEKGDAFIKLDYGEKYILQMNCNGNVKEAVIYCRYLWIQKGDTRIQVPHIEVNDDMTNPNNGDTRIIPCAYTNGSYADIYYTLEDDNVVSDGEPKEHSCICHTFFARPWITFLNIVYNLFGRKTVCCVDMYERHGDILVYTRDGRK